MENIYDKINQNYSTYQQKLEYKELPTIAPPPPPLPPLIPLLNQYPTECQNPTIFTRKDGSGGMRKNKTFVYY